MKSTNEKTTLRRGATLAVVAPAYSLSIISPEIRRISQNRLESFGFNVAIMPHAYEIEKGITGSVQGRLEDLHLAYSDDSIDAIMTSIGGYSSLDLLESLDFDLIRRNPKPIIGYSDISALQNVIYQRTGIRQFSGPHFSTFGMKHGCEDICERFLLAVGSAPSFQEIPASWWSCDEWYLDQEKRKFSLNPGHRTVSPGYAEGIVIGGNLETLVSLSTAGERIEYAGNIVLLEDLSATPAEFLQKLTKLWKATDIPDARGFLIGRFQQPKMEECVLSAFQTLGGWGDVPIVSGLDFGHTTPLSTLPIGGKASVEATMDSSRVRFFLE